MASEDYIPPEQRPTEDDDVADIDEEDVDKAVNRLLKLETQLQKQPREKKKKKTDSAEKKTKKDKKEKKDKKSVEKLKEPKTKNKYEGKLKEIKNFIQG